MAGKPNKIKRQAQKNRLAGNLQKAKALYEEFLATFPTDLDANLRLGEIYMLLEDFDGAVRIYAKCLEKNAASPAILSNLGAALLRQGKPDDAEPILEYALELDPKNINARINLSGVFQAQGKLKKTLDNALQTMTLDPTHPASFNNLGSAFNDLAMFTEAKHAFETAVMLDPQNIDALINIAVCESKLGNRQASIDQYEKVLKMLPPEATQRAEAIKFFAAFEYLRCGDLEKGWNYYEGGFSPLVPLSTARSPNRRFTVPRWDGQPLEGKTLLAWAEQGVGDELMFGTCLPELEKLDGNIIVETDARLVAIFQRSFPNFRVRPTQFDPVSKETSFQDFDYHIPFASLVKLFRKTLADFDSSDAYLKTDPQLDSLFRERLNRKPGEILIGICWRSGKQDPNRNLGYAGIMDFEPIFAIPNARVINLQYSFSEEEITHPKKTLGVELEYWQDVDYKNDLEKVFSIISCLDVVVSVGSAPVPMAGSIGKRTIQYKGGGWPWMGRAAGDGPNPWFNSVYCISTRPGIEPRERLELIAQEICKHF